MKTISHILFAAAFLLVSCGLFAACSAAKRVTPLKTTFLEDVNLNAKKKNLPFDHSLVLKSRGKTKADFRYIYFKPVRTDLLDKSAWTNSSSVLITSQQDYMEKAAEIAKYFHEQIVHEMSMTKDQRLKVVSSPAAPGTLVVEIALTELEFSHPIARAGALAVPVPGTGAAISTISDPHAAFALRITDAATGTLLATAADRKFAPTRIFDLNKLTVSSSAREIAALWAKEIAEALQGDGFSEVSEKRWSILPW